MAAGRSSADRLSRGKGLKTKVTGHGRQLKLMLDEVLAANTEQGYENMRQ